VDESVNTRSLCKHIMILIDFSQVILSSLFSQISKGNEINEDLVRHIFLNSIRNYRNQFKSKYGEVCLCYDGGNYWRKDMFENYKMNRKKLRERTDKYDFDWDEVFDVMGKIRDEIRMVLPYKHVCLRGVEADDVIARLCHRYHDEENIVIISSDKDFQQLQKYNSVDQYSPMTKSFIVCEDPDQFLLEHVIRGDSGDGVPNCMSDDDCLINPDKRQKPITKKRLAQLIENEEYLKQPFYERNKQMIDLNEIPSIINERIDEEYDKPIKREMGVMDYFVSKRLDNLLENIQEFV